MPTAAAPMPDRSQYLHPSTLAALGSIELRARMIVEGLHIGMHRSPEQGFSVEFAQHRPYTAGDDTRFLDWKVFGKTDKLYIKQYQKETNLDLVLLVDTSGSMAYGRGPGAQGPRGQGEVTSPARRGLFRRSSTSAPGPLGPSAPSSWSKFDHAASLAAAMAFLALRGSDRVSLTVFGEGVRRATRLSNSGDHWRTITNALAGSTLEEQRSEDVIDLRKGPRGQGAQGPREEGQASNSKTETQDAARHAGEGRTDFTRLFDQAIATLTRRSLVVLISDLFDDPTRLERGFARLKHRRHDLLVLQTLDPAERTFPFKGPSDFIGLESEGKLPLDPASLRKAYLDALTAHLDAVGNACNKYGFDYLLLDTSEPVGPPLSKFLAKRSAMLSSKA